MASRKLKIDAVSWKTRKVLTNGMWVFVDKAIDLASIRIGQTYSVEVSQLLDGRYKIDKVN